MTPDRLRECLAVLHWSQRGLADWLDMDERQVRRWASGASATPPAVAAWLERWAEFAQANPAPEVKQPRAIGPSTREARVAIRGTADSPEWAARIDRLVKETG